MGLYGNWAVLCCLTACFTSVFTSYICAQGAALPLPSQRGFDPLNKILVEGHIARSLRPNAVLRPPIIVNTHLTKPRLQSEVNSHGSSQTNEMNEVNSVATRPSVSSVSLASSVAGVAPEGLILFSAKVGAGETKEKEEKKQLSHFFRNVPVPSNCHGVYDYGLEISQSTRDELLSLLSTKTDGISEVARTSNPALPAKEFRSRIKESVVLDLAGKGRSVEAVYFKRIGQERIIYKVVVLEGTPSKVSKIDVRKEKGIVKKIARRSS